AGLVQRGGDNVYPPVVVEVGKGATPMRASRPRVESRGFRRIDEGAVFLVYENAVGLPVGLFVVEFDVVVDMRVDGEEVSESVVVEIVEPQAPTAAPGRFQPQPAGIGLVGEETPARVSKQWKGFAFEG